MSACCGPSAHSDAITARMLARVSPGASRRLVAGLVVLACGCAVDPGAVATESRSNGVGGILPSADERTPDQPYQAVEGIVDFGVGKPERTYDAFLTAALADVEAYWAETFAEVYDAPWSPLEGGIWAAWPDRADAIPACGGTDSTYDEVAASGAFYCGDGDFIAYDDHDLMPSLVNDLGVEAVAIVLAHEFGHAVQVRADEFDEPVILKEQQADCFAGAWAAHVAAGDSPTLTFDDDDLRVGLIAMMQIRDPVEAGGLDNPEAHGTGFDRVGAFQDGFIGGAQRCSRFFTEGRLSKLIDIPYLPQFADPNSGNLPFRDPAGSGRDIATLIPASLDAFWQPLLASAGIGFVAPQLVTSAAVAGSVDCEPTELVDDVVWCAGSNAIVVDELFATRLAADPLTGDLSVGYLIAVAYADAVQTAFGSRLSGEPRALAADCFAGAWVASSVPPTPADAVVQLSAGDLDEAVITVIGRSDQRETDDVEGGAFEKVDAFRSGVLSGLAACPVT